MKKVYKWFIVAAVIIAIIVLAATWLTNGFTKGRVTGILYHVDNVYDEIWNLVKGEEWGTQTILTSSTEGAYTDTDFGLFRGIVIPELDIAITRYHSSLVFMLSMPDENSETVKEKSVFFIYDPKTNSLYGEEQESYFEEHFLSHYFSWAKDTSKYTMDNKGEYSFQYENPISWSHFD